jgi:transposase
VADDIGLADALLGLDGFCVLQVVQGPSELRVVVETTRAAAFCANCGSRAQAQERMLAELRDLPCFGRPVRLVWSKRRWRCREVLCPSKTWTEESNAAPARLLLTARAGMEVTRQVGELARPVDTVAKENGLAWGTTMDAVRHYGQPLVEAPGRVGRVGAMGIDETKWLSADAEHSTRYVTSIVDLDQRAIVDLIEGNTAGDIAAWCAQRPGTFLRAVQVVATDLTESYRRGIQGFLDHALRVADPFPVVRVATGTVDLVRRRVQNQTLGHRGRKNDPLYRIRKLLAMGAERLSERGHERLLLSLRLGDPDDEVVGAWLAKESVRDLYLTDNVEDAATLLDKAITGCRADAVPEIRSLGRTLDRWRPEILNHHRTGASNRPTEGQNLCVKKVKRCGHGFRDFENYRLRVLLFAGGVEWPHRPRPPAIR